MRLFGERVPELSASSLKLLEKLNNLRLADVPDLPAAYLYFDSNLGPRRRKGPSGIVGEAAVESTPTSVGAWKEGGGRCKSFDFILGI
jgi:hypothetical protein